MLLHASRWLLSILMLLCAGRLLAGDAPPAAADLVTCPQCEGEGVAKCEAKGCFKGKTPCTRTCLKKTDAWEERKDPANPQIHRWQKIMGTDGGAKYFGDNLIGHLIVRDGAGMPQDGGVCPDCKGTGMMDCPTCHGTGKAKCSLCGGEKQVSGAIAAEYIAKRDQERAARAIVLTDGTTIYGKVISRMPDKVMIKTDEGKMVEVEPGKIQSEPPPEPKAPRKPKEAKK